MNQIVNFYSRISGSYNTQLNNKMNYSQIAAVPMKFIITDGEGNIERYCTGITFRGPHHLKSPTDKSNLFIVEKLPD